MAIKNWSTTAADNDSAAPNGFPENMAPSGLNDSARQVMADVRSWYEDAEWRDFGDTATYVSGTSFTVPTDLTARYVANRRIRAVGSSTGTIYGTISSSSYSAPDTTVNVTWDSLGLVSETLAISLGFTPTNRAIGPRQLGVYFGLVGPSGVTGPPFPDGWSSTKNSAGDYTVTHNLGTTDYVVLLTNFEITGNVNGRVSLASRSGNSFDIHAYDSSDTKSDSYTMFVVIES